MRKTCEYFFAPQSPWTYLGHARLIALAQQYDVAIALKPCDLSKVFSISGGVPLNQRPPQRQAYRLLELQRWSAHLQQPLNLHPRYFPVMPNDASKFIIATQLAHGTNAALQLTGAIMRGVWAEDKNIADSATLIAIATELGHDGNALQKASETASVASAFDQFTDEAIAANVFGAPWYIVDGEGFWGQDRLDFVERAFAK